jgi:hypothetical protein
LNSGKKQLKKTKNNSFFRNRSNAVIVTMFLIALPVCSLTTIYVILSGFNSIFFPDKGFSPYLTSIPWIESKAECQHTGRDWYDNKCWDKEHSPMF